LLRKYFENHNIDSRLSLNEGSRKFVVVSGTVVMPRGSASTDEPHEAPAVAADLHYMVSVVVPQLEDVLTVNAR
jgi:hypothetical protein